METIEAHVGEMETQLSRWGTALDELAAKTDLAAAEAKLDYHRRIDDLKARYGVAQMKLNELRTAESAEEWEIVRASIEKTWDELELAFERLHG